MEQVYEQFFFLKYSGGWSFSEAYNLPIGLRGWFVRRLMKQLTDEADAIEKASKTSSSPGATTHTLNAHNQPSPPTGWSSKDRQG